MAVLVAVLQLLPPSLVTPLAFMWPHHCEPQAALTHDKPPYPPPPSPSDPAIALPQHLTAHTHTHIHLPPPPACPTNTQAKQNKSGSNNLIQFDWPDEQVLQRCRGIEGERERGRERERWEERERAWPRPSKGRRQGAHSESRPEPAGLL